ncbi:odorant receptor 85c-like [Leptidea sinapis]|uniref:odorant receptor 85c-like n=1 Tax=Leptidea sinapis TaxID=189913 RepID=UPI0021C3FA3F|nr:odorant receptor 85c-like [Leptidea sinapis]
MRHFNIRSISHNQITAVFEIFAGSMILICGQFSLLRDYCLRIGGRGNMLSHSNRRDSRAHYRIKLCHKYHVIILRMVSKLNYLLRTIIGVYFFVATLTLCSVAIEIQYDLSATQMISLLQYISATLVQIYLFCHYGDSVMNESFVGLGEGPFACAWWSLGPKVRRELSILCCGMSQRCRLFAGPFNTLDLLSFVQIVRTAYSVYAVLRQTSE